LKICGRFYLSRKSKGVGKLKDKTDSKRQLKQGEGMKK